MDEEIYSQYNSEETDEAQVPTTTSNEFKIRHNAYTTEIRVGDQVFNVINPEYIEVLSKQINDLTQRCNFLENELRNVRAEVRNKDVAINRTINTINSRFGFSN